jgi:hypothetical protein
MSPNLFKVKQINKLRACGQFKQGSARWQVGTIERSNYPGVCVSDLTTVQSGFRTETAHVKTL